MKQKYEIIVLDKIFDPEKPLRGDLSPESVEDLAASIKRIGIIEPLIVAQTENGYEVIAGHRRLVAAEIAGLTEAPCLVVEAEGMEKEVLKLHENLARAEINPIDWANHLTYLKQHYQLSNAKIAEMLGTSQSFVEQHIEVLKYPAPLLEGLKRGHISFAASRELNYIKNPARRDIYIHHAIRGGVSSTMAAQWRRQANSQALPPPPISTEANTQTPLDIPAPGPVICPVCDNEIPPGEIVTLQVHMACQPKPATQP